MDVKSIGVGIMLSFVVSMSLITEAFGQTCNRNYKASLDIAFANTVTFVRSGNDRALLDQIGNQGLTMGPDGPAYSKAELQTYFQNKSGPFCLIFTCQGRRGLIGQNIKREGAQIAIDSRFGTASIIIGANTSKELMLSYRFNSLCKWELNALAAV